MVCVVSGHHLFIVIFFPFLFTFLYIWVVVESDWMVWLLHAMCWRVVLWRFPLPTVF
jgi:hypothetical protein